MTIYIEVDLKNKELPTGRMAKTMAELSRLVGRQDRTVATAIARAKKNGGRCRYVKVEIDEEEED